MGDETEVGVAAAPEVELELEPKVEVEGATLLTREQFQVQVLNELQGFLIHSAEQEAQALRAFEITEPYTHTEEEWWDVFANWVESPNNDNKQLVK